MVARTKELPWISRKSVRIATNHSGRLQKQSQMCQDHNPRDGATKILILLANIVWNLALAAIYIIRRDWSAEKGFEPDAHDDLEVILERPFDVLVEVEFGVGRQMCLRKNKNVHEILLCTMIISGW
jgi:hypothetical protein